MSGKLMSKGSWKKLEYGGDKIKKDSADNFTH